jgi:hypothetical protein
MEIFLKRGFTFSKRLKEEVCWRRREEDIRKKR